MISAIACSLAIWGRSSPSQDQGLQPVPTAVVLMGVNDHLDFNSLMRAANKASNLHIFNESANGLLCCQQTEGTYVFVYPGYPPYARLRLHRHLVDLFHQFGYQKTFSYRELATPEFEPYLSPIWQSQPKAGPNPETKMVFYPTLATSTVVRGNALDFSFGPGIKLTDSIRQELVDAPARPLLTQPEVQEEAKKRRTSSSEWRTLLLKPTPVAQEIALTRNALESFRDYFESEIDRQDQELESTLTDPIWDETKQRRKIRTGRDLKAALPKAFDLMMHIRQEELSYVDQKQSDEERLDFESASLTHKYSLSFRVAVGDKIVTLSLPHE